MSLTSARELFASFANAGPEGAASLAGDEEVAAGQATDLKA